MGLGLNGFPLFSLDVVGAVFPPMKLRERTRGSQVMVSRGSRHYFGRSFRELRAGSSLRYTGP